MLSFQGLIKDAGGTPITGTVDLEFRIFDAATFGNLVDMDGKGGVVNTCAGDVTCVFAVTATSGAVTTKFGPVHPSAFDGCSASTACRWLEVSIRFPAGAGIFSALSRVEMVTAPATAEQVNLPPTGTAAITVNDATGNVGVNGSLFVNGFNLHLAGPDFSMAAPGRGDGGLALVHFGDGVNERLVINFANDFNNGVQVQSNLEVTGTLDITGTPSVDGVKFPDGTLQTTASTDTDTLGALSCADGQIAKFNTTTAQWECAADTDTNTDTLGALACLNGEVAKWNGAAWVCAADDSGAGGGGNTLDQAYDQGGAGAGRIITADAGAVQIDGSGGLTVTGTITSGSSIVIDGMTDTISSRGGPLTINGGIFSNCCGSRPFLTGCDDPTCEAAVCGADAFCCQMEWDASCAAAANILCPKLCSVQALALQTDGGFVGIGTAFPTQRLDVAGNIKASGTIQSGSSIVIDGNTSTITATGGTISLDNENLVTSGVIESNASGFKFPDGTMQTTAAAGDSHSLDAADGSPIDAVLVDNDGNVTMSGTVGIGTTGPLVGSTVGAVRFMLPQAPVNANLSRFRHCALDASSSLIYCLIDTVKEYDPVANNIVVRASLPLQDIYLGAAASSSKTGKIYLFGGFGCPVVFAGTCPVADTWVDSIFSYDPATDTVTRSATTLPTGIAMHDCVESSVTKKIYCFGGAYSGGKNPNVIEYNPVSDTVSQFSWPNTFFFPDCVDHPPSGNIYCFDNATQAIVEYNPISNTATIQGARTPVGAFVGTSAQDTSCFSDPLTELIVCLGGIMDQLWTYDPVTDSARLQQELPIRLTASWCIPLPALGKAYCHFTPVQIDEIHYEYVLEYEQRSVTTSLQVGDPGDGTGATSNAWNVFSSRDFKRDIQPLGAKEYQELLQQVAATNVFRYRYRNDPRALRRLGVIAEEAPRDIVTPNGKGVNLANYSAFLLAAIKAQQAEVDGLEARLAAMERHRSTEAKGEKGGSR